MASLAEQFLADFGGSDGSASDGGSADGDRNDVGGGDGGGGAATDDGRPPEERAHNGAADETSSQPSGMQVDDPQGDGPTSGVTAPPPVGAPPTPDSVVTPAGALDEARLAALLDRVAPSAPPDGPSGGGGGGGTPPPAPDYALVSAAVAATAAVDAAIATADAALRAAYAPRFPELDALLPSPGPYAAVVAALGNDPSPRVDLAAALPSSAAVITVHLAAASTAGVRLSAAEADAVAAAARRVGHLDAARRRLTAFVTSAAGVVAPNLCALVGAGLAAALLAATHVGGGGGGSGGGFATAPASSGGAAADGGRLRALVSMPACNVQVVGAAGSAEAASTGALLGDAAAARRHRGLVYASPLVRALPPHLHARAGRTLAAKVSLAARLDLHRRPAVAAGAAGAAAAPPPDAGAGGAALRAAIEAKFGEWTKPPPRRTAKPLPVPDAAPSKRRGGKRARRAKALYGVSDIGRAAGRLAFGDGAGGDAYGRAELEDDEEGGGGGDGGGAGLLGSAGGGAGKRLRFKSQPRLPPRRGGGGKGGAAQAAAPAARHCRRTAAAAADEPRQRRGAPPAGRPDWEPPCPHA